MIDHQPGDVVQWDETRRAMLIDRCLSHPSEAPHWHISDGGWDRNPPPTEVRPLAVIDPQDEAQVERLERARWEAMGGDWDHLPLSTHDSRIERMQAALREFTKPDTPAEPTTTGALVRDRDGNLWARTELGVWVSLTRLGLARSWDGLCRLHGPVEVVRDE